MRTPRLVHVFPAFATGGPEVRTALLINALTEFAHTIVSLNGDTSGKCRLDPSASVMFAPATPPRNTMWLWELGWALCAENPNLLVTYGWGGTDAIFAARLAGLCPTLHVEDGFLPDEAVAQKQARRLVRCVAFRLAAALVVPSRSLEHIATSSWRVPARRVHYVPNGVDTDRFSPPLGDGRQQARARLGSRAEELVVGTVGMLRPDKNHARLLRAFASIRSDVAVRLAIIGDGPCRAELEALARDLGVADRVTFAGAIVDPAWCYKGFDLFALSSDTEQMPLSVLEAMASGLAVVSTDVGDVAAMIAPPVGGGVTALSDEGAFRSQLELFCHDEATRATAGAQNRARALEHFSITRMVDSYAQLFRRFITHRRRKH